MDEIDIGMVVNNAGISGTVSTYLNLPISDISNVIETNFMSLYLINQVVVPKLSERRYRSAIINFSSCTGVFTSHLLGTYPASKQIVDIYSRTMSVECRDRIDVLCSRPFGVITPMTRMHRGPWMISPEECVLSTLADLGKADTTFSGYKHKLQGAFMELATE